VFFEKEGETYLILFRHNLNESDYISLAKETITFNIQHNDAQMIVIQHNDIWYNHTEHNCTQHLNIQCNDTKCNIQGNDLQC